MFSTIQFDEQVDPAFLENEIITRETVTKRQDARTAKDGELTLSGTIESFIHTSEGDGKKFSKSDRPYPPDPKKQVARDDPTKKYNAAIAMHVRPTSIPRIAGTSELRDDGAQGWKVRCAIQYFDDGADYLKANYKRAYLPENLEDEECERIRYFISADGLLRKEEWFNVAPGSSVKVTAPDNEDTPLRMPHPKRTGVRWVQPSTPCTFFKVLVERYVNVIKVDVEDVSAAGQAAGAPAPGPAEPYVPTGNPEEDALAAAAADAAIADAAAAGTAASAASAKPTKTKKVSKITAFEPSFKSKAVVVSEDYDPDLSQSERMHEQSDPYYTHNLVPVMDLARKRANLPNGIDVYWYVKERMMTPWNPQCPPDMKGVTILRTMKDQDYLKDFIKEFQNVRTPTCVIRFRVYQWKGKPNTSECYIVKAMAHGDEQWRNYGITNCEHYGLLISANCIPVHVHAKIWTKATIDHESNKPEFLEAVPGDRYYKPEMANVKGFIVCGATILPDYLRYFRGPNGLEVTKEFAAEEFSFWESENKKTKKKQFLLKPRGATKPNPLNALKEHSPVVALGNGYIQDGTEGDEYGDNHAYEGNAASFFEGNHKFYVLLSRALTDAEKAAWMGKPVDELVAQLKEKEKVVYWIFAVRNDAKMAKNYGRMPAAIAPAPAVREQSPKREREEHHPAAVVQQQDEEEEDEVFYQKAARVGAEEE